MDLNNVMNMSRVVKNDVNLTLLCWIYKQIGDKGCDVGALYSGSEVFHMFKHGEFSNFSNSKRNLANLGRLPKY